jgi:hypothetical protein
MVPYLTAFGRTAEILVYTPQEFESMSEVGFGWMVHQEGVILYERPPDRGAAVVPAGAGG